MTTGRLGHLDESDQLCKRHLIELDGLLHLAAIGSRTSSFNHDIASKIQGVMMAVDEIGELGATPELTQAVAAAQSALQELNNLLQVNRTLTKPPVTSRAGLQDLVTKAAVRVGVMLRGARVAQDVEVAVPLMTQALAIVLGVAGGRERRRSIELGVKAESSSVELTFPLANDAVIAGELLAIASWIVERDRGALHCSTAAITIRLPVQ